MSVFDQLYPLNRSVTGCDLRKSLSIINEYVPLKVMEYPTGEKCYDWEIPKEWNVKEAYILDSKGNRIVDFADNNLHLLAYSTPFKGKVSKVDLMEHIYSLEEMPDAIPYITSVYEERWGFCIKHSQLEAFDDEEYFVHIDAELSPGSLSIGEGYIQGKTDREIVLFTYTGHPSMANDQLSGILTLILIYLKLYGMKEALNYSYRFLFCPETIGTAAYLNRNLEKLRQRMIAGFTVTFIGDQTALKYKQTKSGNTLGDRAAKNSLLNGETRGSVFEYTPFGSDERHFNAPGIDLPFGAFFRAGAEGYEEYHTSLDNKSIISEEKMSEAAQVIFETLQNMEFNEDIQTKYFGFEPKLDKLGLYPTLGKRFNNKEEIMNVLAIWRLSQECDDTIDIANLLKVKSYQLAKAVNIGKKIGLIT